jgi:hypothetical protein
MARTKQVIRKKPGGQAPRKELANAPAEFDNKSMYEWSGTISVFIMLYQHLRRLALRAERVELSDVEKSEVEESDPGVEQSEAENANDEILTGSDENLPDFEPPERLTQVNYFPRYKQLLHEKKKELEHEVKKMKVSAAAKENIMEKLDEWESQLNSNMDRIWKQVVGGGLQSFLDDLLQDKISRKSDIPEQTHIRAVEKEVLGMVPSFDVSQAQKDKLLKVIRYWANIQVDLIADRDRKSPSHLSQPTPKVNAFPAKLSYTPKKPAIHKKTEPEEEAIKPPKSKKSDTPRSRARTAFKDLYNLLNGSDAQVLTYIKAMPDPDYAFLKYVFRDLKPDSKAESLVLKATQQMAKERVEAFGRGLKIKDGCPKKNVSEYDFRRCVTKKYNQLLDLNIPFL